ncbi:MAG: amidohydrolase family protein [Oscillospiraceae bacterium]
MKQRIIVDAHAHIFPGKIAQRASVSIGAFYDLGMETCGYPHLLKESGEKIGVRKYLVCSPATTINQVSSINDFIHDKCEKYPEFLGFGTLHPAMRDYERELERMVQMGLRGVKFHPDLQEFYIDDKAMFPIYQKISETGLPVLFHTGDLRFDYSAPSRLANVAQRFPQLTCIASHLGGYQRWNEARQTLTGAPNVYFDTSSSLFVLTREEALELISLYTPQKLMFGTDFPMWTHEDELQRFLSLGLPQQAEEQILHRTFEELFGLHLEDAPQEDQ